MASTTEKVELKLGASSTPTIALNVQVTFSLSDTTDEWTVSGGGFEYVSAAADSKTSALIGWLSKILGVT